MVMQILTRIGVSVMMALIKGFQVQSHTPDPAATLFLMKWVEHTKNGVHNCDLFYINKPFGLLLYQAKV